jgi:hypothetical protein
LLAVVLTGCASVQKVSAARVLQNGPDHIRLTDEPCESTAGVLATLPPEMRKTLKAGSVYWHGKHYAACYQEHPNHILIVDESGDGGQIDLNQFLRETEI